MDQATMNKYFQSSLGQQCNALYSTSDDRVFIRLEEAEKHTRGELNKTAPLEDKTVTEWFEEWSGNDPNPIIRDQGVVSDELTTEVSFFIMEKAEHKGWENAEHLAAEKYGEDATRSAMQRLQQPSAPNVQQKFNSLDAAIKQLEVDHPEFWEEHTTGWDMMQTLRHMRGELTAQMPIHVDEKDLPF